MSETLDGSYWKFILKTLSLYHSNPFKNSRDENRRFSRKRETSIDAVKLRC